MAEEEKACNCEISVRRALPALLPTFFFFLSPSFLLSPCALQNGQCSLIGSVLMRVNDRRTQASLWTKQIIIARSEEVQRRIWEFLLLSPLSSVFGEWRKQEKIKPDVRLTHMLTLTHLHTHTRPRPVEAPNFKVVAP